MYKDLLRPRLPVAKRFLKYLQYIKMKYILNMIEPETFNFGIKPEKNMLSSGVNIAYECKYDDSVGNYQYQGDCLKFMDAIISKYPNGCFDMIFADPPYFLSNGGISCSNGEMISVNKGHWDKSKGIDIDHLFHLNWLSKCQKLLKPNGTIWVSGTMHAIFSIGYAMQTLGFKILNDITWEKPNPPPNLSCRYFTHSTETLIWAGKSISSKHYFDYDSMRSQNEGKQMKTVWKISPPKSSEKKFGKHPTQKPIELLQRCIQSSTSKGDFIFDPFAGSATTGVAATLLDRHYCGIDLEQNFVDLSIQRLVDVRLTKMEHKND
jgi:site-specific DNA-methyltransferase (adenine-specific)